MSTRSREIVVAFLEVGDFSKAAAARLEGALAATKPDDESAAADLLDLLASYAPGGGEFLYNENDLRRRIAAVLRSGD